jgi:hypothetical protein
MSVERQNWQIGGGGLCQTRNFVRLLWSVKFFLYFPKEGCSGKEPCTIWRLCLTVERGLVPPRLIKSS